MLKLYTSQNEIVACELAVGMAERFAGVSTFVSISTGDNPERLGDVPVVLLAVLLDVPFNCMVLLYDHAL